MLTKLKKEKKENKNKKFVQCKNSIYEVNKNGKTSEN